MLFEHVPHELPRYCGEVVEGHTAKVVLRYCADVVLCHVRPAGRSQQGLEHASRSYLVQLINRLQNGTLWATAVHPIGHGSRQSIMVASEIAQKDSRQW